MCPEDVPIEQCPFRVTKKARKAHLHTPRIREMAEEGQILTNFYSPRAICTPSRAGYLSGRDPSRYGITDNLFRILQSSSARGGMPTSEKSVAKYLKELGYFTGYTGKWHLGATNGTDDAAFTPINHGFDFVKFFIEVSKYYELYFRLKLYTYYVHTSHFYSSLHSFCRVPMEKRARKVH